MDRIDALAADFGRLYLRMHRLLNLRMARSGASLAQTRILMFIQARQAVRATDIASTFGFAPRTVTGAIDGLERDGLVQREAHGQDRRAKWISLTPAGSEAIAATEPLRLNLIEQIFGMLNEAECGQLRGLIGKLSATVEQLEADE